MAFVQPPYWARERYGAWSTRMATKVVTPASTLPITLADAKAHIKAVTTDEDTQVTAFIQAATDRIERDTGLSLLTQTIDIFVDGVTLQDRFELPVSPIQSVTSFSYTDTAGIVQVWPTTQYEVDLASPQPRIGLAMQGMWPTDLRFFQPITIRVVAGWTSAALIPAGLILAIKMVVAWLDQNRAPGMFERQLYADWIGPYRRKLVG